MIIFKHLTAILDFHFLFCFFFFQLYYQLSGWDDLHVITGLAVCVATPWNDVHYQGCSPQAPASSREHLRPILCSLGLGLETSLLMVSVLVLPVPVLTTSLIITNNSTVMRDSWCSHVSCWNPNILLPVSWQLSVHCRSLRLPWYIHYHFSPNFLIVHLFTIPLC